ncbi:hypothetical protein WUBG_04203 [Wuchereria bancrofti]|uniref:Uncharacterized protein n=1 Tax=Wuchereria bancrofti TaxID=6293 RepID=J9BCG7_WUCBA|nr:hypothetical protein WUBG_04203 [Wuchereria bancrofti]
MQNRIIGGCNSINIATRMWVFFKGEQLFNCGKRDGKGNSRESKAKRGGGSFDFIATERRYYFGIIRMTADVIDATTNFTFERLQQPQPAVVYARVGSRNVNNLVDERLQIAYD